MNKNKMFFLHLLNEVTEKMNEVNAIPEGLGDWFKDLVDWTSKASEDVINWSKKAAEDAAEWTKNAAINVAIGQNKQQLTLMIGAKEL